MREAILIKSWHPRKYRGTFLLSTRRAGEAGEVLLPGQMESVQVMTNRKENLMYVYYENLQSDMQS